MKKTTLHPQHLQAKASLIEFAGWLMPLNYGSQLEEHHAVRRDAGMFDVSHMTVVDVLGAGGRQFLRYLLCGDIDSLKHPGAALYSCMLNSHGGIMDDLIVYYRAPDNYRLVFNAATREKVLAWLKEKANGLAVYLQERLELAMIAVQGPNALTKSMSVLSAAKIDAISTLQPFEGVDVDDWFIARTGYTGEEGLEFIVPQGQVEQLWQSLVHAQITPCGLGARDSLRMEAGMLLYGQDMDETTTPLESGLAWTIAWQPDDRDFIGRGALALQKETGIKRKLVGLILQQKSVLRHGMQVMTDAGVQGVITSGGFSPTLDCSIALARVATDIPEQCQVSIRDKLADVKVVKPRFVRHGQVVAPL